LKQEIQKRTETRKTYSYLKKNLHAVEEMAPCTQENRGEAAVQYIYRRKERNKWSSTMQVGKRRKKILNGKEMTGESRRGGNSLVGSKWGR